MVLLDVPKIRFALHQVIDNAFKFSGKQVDISIRMGSHREKVYVVVSDSGIGIPETEILKVFEKFYQIDEEQTGQIRGFGLGLFYAQDFIRQHGSSVYANNHYFSSATNEAIQDVLISLPSYKSLDWILGKESTANETFNSTEQTLVSTYLKQGGKLLVSGSEIAWDLDNS